MKTRFINEDEQLQIRKVLENWRVDNDSNGVMAFIAEKSAHLVPALQSVCSEMGLALAGAIFPAIIENANIHARGVLLFYFNSMPEFQLIPLTTDSSTLNAEKMVDALTIEFNGHEKAVFMLFDGMLPNISSTVEALYLIWGDEVNYMGANAGSESFQSVPCLFNNSQFLSEAVLLMSLPDHAGSAMEHGYHHLNQEILATSTSGNRIATIDWKPAFIAYQEIARKQYQLKITKENFYEFAVHYPLGIVKADGNVLIRIPVTLENDGSIYCVGEVPENVMLTLMKAIEGTSEDSISFVKNRLSLVAINQLLVFYCAGRRLHMGAAAQSELSRMQSSIAPVTVVGALSLGEIGGSKNDVYPQFQNATIIAIPWKPL